MKKNRITAGIDPGQKGAVAVFGPDGLDIWNLKDCVTETGSFKSLDAVKFSKLLDSAFPPYSRNTAAGDIEIFCEESLIVHGNGIKTARPIFDSRGVMRAVFALRGLRVQYVAPTTWKRFYGLLKADKAASVEKAIELLPKYADFFRKQYQGRLIHQDGRAEAALIALYGRRQEK